MAAEIKRIFKVDGKPFYPLGRHHLYMGGYTARDESVIERSFQGLKQCNGNTMCVPIYWDQIEPEEGKYDFSSVDTLLRISRKYESKLIFLLFAHWKNGVMDFAPAYMKANPKKYRRVVTQSGGTLWVLSSHCKANLAADKKAYTAVCEHLKEVDGKQQTVIGMQIENEAGILGNERDYGPEAQAVYDSPVPAKLMSAMKKAGRGEVYDLWQKAGGKSAGSWPEIFGVEAGELMTAWSISSFINEIAGAGKAAYNIPMFINVWCAEAGWWPVPGEAYPSGGAVHKTVDIWKWFAPNLDLLAPDNFQPDRISHNAVYVNYVRDDNPLFIVESHPNLNGMFYDMADFNAIGYFVHFSQAEDGTIPPEQQRRIQLTRAAAAVLPLLLKYQGTGRIHAFEEGDPGIHGRLLYPVDFEGHMGLIGVNDRNPTRGAGLLIQAGKNEFYIVGINFRLMLRPKPVLGRSPVALLGGMDLSHPSFINYTERVDVGHFDKKGKFISDFRRNGDDMRGGVWVGPDDTVTRIITCD